MSDTTTHSDASGYTITRTYDAPRELVWRAITEAELFAQWFGMDLQLDVHEWDLRPQGNWRATMFYEGNEMPWSGRFLEIDEPDRLAVAFTDQAAGVDEAFDVMTYTLVDLDGRTELTLVQSGGNLTAEQYAQACEGTAGFLDKMATVIAGL